MHPDEATSTRVERGVVVAEVLALGVALCGVVAAAAQSAWWEAVAALALLVLVATTWWRRRSGWIGPGPTLLVATAVLASSLLPAAGSLGVLLLLLVPLLAALDVGLWLGAVLAAVFPVAFTVAALGFLDDAAVGEVVAENALVLVLLLLSAGVGSLIASIEHARAEAARTGAALAVANAELRRSLVVERDLVLAEERARSAAELHDGLGHRLTLVSLALEYAQQVRTSDPARSWAEIGSAAETTRTALAEMRLWVRALAPPEVVDGAGGAAAYDAIAAAFRGTGLDVRVSHRGEEGSLDREVALFATRFIQEGLTNVLRHAGASRVDIEVRQSPQQVLLSVADDGSGDGGVGAEGFGRRSLRERAERLGGRLGAGRSALGGFELSAVVPLERPVAR